MTQAPQNTHPPQSLLSSQADNSRSLIVVLTIMAFLATLAVLFSLSANRLKQGWQDDLGRTATVQLMLENAETRQAKIDTAVSILKSSLQDAVVTPLSSAQSQELLKPWLGNLDLPDDLPLPALISIDLPEGMTFDASKLTSALSEEGLIADVDDHSRWSDQIGRSGRGLQAAALALLALIFAAGIAVSGFATQAALSAQRDIIRVLVQVGAEDRFIAKLFVGQAGMRGLKGAVIGIIFGTITAIFLSLRRSKETALLPDLGLHWTDGFWLLLLCIGFTVICALAAGITTFRLLKRERRRS